MIRSHLHISRDLPFRKCHRHQEPDAKGIRPVTVQFEKHAVTITTLNFDVIFSLHLHPQDRNAVLSKASDLVGTGIFISEDFPKVVLRKRTKLLKFAKEVIDKIYVHFDTNV